jgi:uncharacterized protein (TIGR00369 family)
MTDPTPIPPEFRPIDLAPNPYLQMVGPLYARPEGDGDLVLGFRVEPKHCNPGGTCHGGMMMTLADMLLIIGSNAQAKLHRYLTTVNLANDFLAPAPQGSWIEGRAQVLRVTKSLVFAQGLWSLGGTPVLRSSGILKPVGDADPRFGVQRYFRPTAEG